MKTKLIEATSQKFNWGKFCVSWWDDAEWDRMSGVDGLRLIAARGWDRHHAWVLDLQTGEGACFRLNPKGSAHADLSKHKIWVCPLYEPFLQWLYTEADLNNLPDVIDLPAAECAMYGYRREGREAP